MPIVFRILAFINDGVHQFLHLLGNALYMLTAADGFTGGNAQTEHDLIQFWVSSRKNPVRASELFNLFLRCFLWMDCLINFVFQLIKSVFHEVCNDRFLVFKMLVHDWDRILNSRSEEHTSELQ